MSWIDETGATTAGEGLRRIYDALVASDGAVDALARAQSLNPEALAAHLALYEALLHGESGLSRADREAIAVVVSATNNSTYCVSRHAAKLARFDHDNTRLKQIVSGFRFLNLPDRSARMLSYAAKLTATPARIAESDVDELREAGFSDSEILDINLVAAYFNFANRVALGLGVKLEPPRGERGEAPGSAGAPGPARRAPT